jgi:hypothetical protein
MNGKAVSFVPLYKKLFYVIVVKRLRHHGRGDAAMVAGETIQTKKSGAEPPVPGRDIDLF